MRLKPSNKSLLRDENEDLEIKELARAEIEELVKKKRIDWIRRSS